MEPLYDELSTSDLLNKCLDGKTQNNNEVFNKVVWDFCSKEVYVGRDVVLDAVSLAVCFFNDGAVTISKLFQKLGIGQGQLSKRISFNSDEKRIEKCKRKSTDECKQRRKRLRALKKGFADSKKEEEGNIYQSGAH